MSIVDMSIVDMLQIYLPKNEIVNNFLKLDDEKKLLCLSIGLRCIEDSTCCVEDFYNQEMSEVRANERKKYQELEEKYKESLNVHQEELKTLGERVYQNASLEHEEKYKQLQERCKSLENQYYNLQQNVESDKRIEMENFNTKLMSSLNEKEENYRSREDTLRKDYEERLTLERNKNSKLQMIDNNSSRKGKEGEEETEKLLNRLFPKAEIVKCSSESKRGDFNILLGNMNMMVDVKNYKKNVQKTEIDKFHRDMKENPEYTCGVLLSLESGVCNKEDMSLEVCNERPIIYIHNFLEDTKKMIYACSIVQMIHSIENLNLKNQEIVDKVTQLQKESKKKYVSTKKDLDKFYNKMTKSLEEHESMIKDLFTLFQSKNS
jgi:hypothetical protein